MNDIISRFSRGFTDNLYWSVVDVLVWIHIQQYWIIRETETRNELIQIQIQHQKTLSSSRIITYQRTKVGKASLNARCPVDLVRSVYLSYI